MATEIVDSYSESNVNDFASCYSVQPGIGQSFTGNGDVLDSAMFYVARLNSISGNVVMKIYAHSGTFGTSSVPTGSALATSGTIDASTFSLSYELKVFTFTGANKITLVNGTKYVVTLEFSGGLRLEVGTRFPGGVAGNLSTFNGSSWSTNSGVDVAFYVYGDIPIAGPANLKTYNTNPLANIKTINTNPIANVKSLNTNV